MERWKALRPQRKASGRDDRELGFSFGWGTMNTRNSPLARWIKLGLYRAFLAQILAPLLQSTQTEQIDVPVLASQNPLKPLLQLHST